MKIREILKKYFIQFAVSVAILGLVIWKLDAIKGMFTGNGGTHSSRSANAVPLAPGTWRFIVSGDSRNCGDIVMPAIAAHSARFSPNFYWHLGDLRAIYKIDEDMEAAAAHDQQTLTCDAYYRRAWPDFIEHQIAAFGSTRFYVGIGNHEVIPPENPDLFTAQFREWLKSPALDAQRRKDNETGSLDPRTYYHWIEGGVDFIYLDNASNSFSQQEVDWFDARITSDRNNDEARIVVIGMHEALPDGIASDHSMCDHPDPAGCASGRHVYDALLKLQAEKPVYVLASHSHFYMKGIFDNQPPGHRLPGWIVGTAGAERYSLPKNAPPGARTDVYGYMVATVAADRRGIDFEFEQIQPSDIPASVLDRYPPSAVAWCFAHNSRNIDPGGEETSHRCTPPAPAAH
jgi:hypothetical protein